MKRSILIYTFFAMLLFGCAGDDDGESSPSTPTPQQQSPATESVATPVDLNIKITKEASENNALTLTRKSTGESVTYYAQRDDSGYMSQLQEILHSKDGIKTRVVFSPATREFVSETGLRLKIYKTDSGTIVAEYSDPASGASLITNLSELMASPKNILADRAALASKKPLAEPPPSTIPVTVQTKKCGDVASIGAVRVGVKAGTYSSTYTATSVGTGAYIAYVPNYSKQMAVSLTTAKEYLGKAKDAINEFCGTDPVLLLTTGTAACTMSAAAIASSTLLAGTPLAASWLSLCESGVAAAIAYCELMKFASVDTPTGVDLVNGPGAIISQAQDLFIDMIPDEINLAQIGATTDSLPPVSSPLQDLSLSATSATLTLEDNSLSASSLAVAPSAPAEGQGYVASSDLTCIPQGTTSILSIQGTDGYSNATKQLFDSAITKAATVSLSVPGAQTGVRDTLTLDVTPSVGKPIQRTTSLVFH